MEKDVPDGRLDLLELERRIKQPLEIESQTSRKF